MSAAVRSMTGFARARVESGWGTVTVSLRAVNHRALDPHFHMTAELDPLEGAIRKALKEKMARGHVDVRVSLQRAGAAGGAHWNRELLGAWLRAFSEASREHGLESKPDLNAAFRLPGMLTDEGGEDPASDLEESLMKAVNEALDELNAVRSREGAALAAEMLAHVTVIRKSAAQIEAARAEVSQVLHARLREKLSELLGSMALDPARIAQEAAMLADRSEIAEETARLGIHIAALDDLLRAGGEVGKKIEFLLQEMLRETNTILSKSNSGGEPGRRVAELALAVKSEIEKIREQALNLE